MVREAAMRDLAKEVELSESLLRKALGGNLSADLRLWIGQLLEPLARISHRGMKQGCLWERKGFIDTTLLLPARQLYDYRL